MLSFARVGLVNRDGFLPHHFSQFPLRFVLKLPPGNWHKWRKNWYNYLKSKPQEKKKVNIATFKWGTKTLCAIYFGYKRSSSTCNTKQEMQQHCYRAVQNDHFSPQHLYQMVIVLVSSAPCSIKEKTSLKKFFSGRSGIFSLHCCMTVKKIKSQQLLKLFQGFQNKQDTGYALDLPGIFTTM